MGAGISGGGHMGPTSLPGPARGVVGPPGLVVHSRIPLTSSLSQNFSKTPEKIILEFHGI